MGLTIFFWTNGSDCWIITPSPQILTGAGGRTLGRETIDCRGSRYTMPLVALAKAMRSAEPGTEFEVVCDYDTFEKELRLWCGNTKHQLKEIDTSGGVTRAVIVKG